jgi:predicted O-linked N-acetylglucosamine transferase (SPINDLY family)
MPSIPDLLAAGLRHHQAGQLQQAEQAYRQILQADPHHSDALHLLGLVAFQVGKHDVAINLIRQAIGTRPFEAGYHFNLGNVYQGAGRAADALKSFEQAVLLNPDHADAQYNLGNALMGQGKIEPAARCFQAAVKLKPNYPEAWSNLGFIYTQLGKLDEAVAACRESLRLRPQSPTALNNLGHALYEKQQQAESLRCFEEAVRLKPDYADAILNLGNIYNLQGRAEDALACFQKATQLQPQSATARRSMGQALANQRKLGEAVEELRQAVRLNPNSADAQYDLGSVLLEKGDIEEAVACLREALRLKPDHALAAEHLGFALRQQGKLEEADACYRTAQQTKPNNSFRILQATLLPPIYQSMDELREKRQKFIDNIRQLHAEGVRLDPTKEIVPSTFYLAYQGMNERELQHEIARLFVPSEHAALSEHAAQASVKRQRIKIGFISKFFRNHTIGRLMQGLVARLPRERFEVTVISAGSYTDDLANDFRKHADRFVVIPANIQAALSILRELKLDVLFYADIGMEWLTYSLAFSRLAPIQCVTWGHPITTGIDTVDYFISSDLVETASAQEHYTEKLVRLKTLPTYYYRPAPSAPFRGRDLFGLPEKGHLYACLQNLFKFHPEFDELIAGILRRDPQGHLVLIKAQYPQWTEMLLTRFRRTMPDVVDRVILLPWQKHETFLNLNAVCDVLLDPIHFGSGNTCYEGLGLGVPIVTRPSEFLRGRVTLGLYKKMNVLDCVARTSAEYIDIAVRLGTDAEYRRAIREKILAVNSVVYEDRAAVEEMAEFLERAVPTR